jgi:hypothetical protein
MENQHNTDKLQKNIKNLDQKVILDTKETAETDELDPKFNKAGDINPDDESFQED